MGNPDSSRPDHFIVIDDATNIVIKDLYIQNWPVHCFDITGSTGVTITGLTLDNTAGDAPNSASSGLPAAHNSDGFDISSTTNMVLSNTIVKNQDDCVAVTSGTNITVTGMTCSGGHGLSIGSVGGKSDNTVTDITFSDSTVSNSQNGCRIKTNSGTTGTVSLRTLLQIRDDNIDQINRSPMSCTPTSSSPGLRFTESMSNKIISTVDQPATLPMVSLLMGLLSPT
jgi:polygalacturonase